MAMSAVRPIHDDDEDLDDRDELARLAIPSFRQAIDEDFARARRVLRTAQQSLESSPTSNLATSAEELSQVLKGYHRLLSAVVRCPSVVQMLYAGVIGTVSDRLNRRMDILEKATGRPPCDWRLDLQQVLPMLTTEAGQPDVQLDGLAFITCLNKLSNHAQIVDPTVGNTIRELLWSHATPEIQDQIQRLPPWYIAGHELDWACGECGTLQQKSSWPSRLPNGALVTVHWLAQSRGPIAAIPLITSCSIWQRFRHPNVCEFVGACVYASRPFIVTAPCANGSLNSFLTKDEPSRIPTAVEMLFQMAEVLQALHLAGIVHGDVRCRNILVTGEPRAKLAGLTHCLDWNALRFELLTEKPAHEVGVTLATTSAKWMAPECMEGSIPNASADVYAFGMTLYEALTGRPPFEGITDRTTLLHLKKANTLPDRDVGQAITDELWRLIEDSCHPNPLFRPSMQIVTMTLRSLRGRQQIVPMAHARSSLVSAGTAMAHTPSSHRPLEVSTVGSASAMANSSVDASNGRALVSTRRTSVTVVPVLPKLTPDVSPTQLPIYHNPPRTIQASLMPDPIKSTPPSDKLTTPGSQLRPGNSRGCKWATVVLVVAVIITVAVVVPMAVTRSTSSSSPPPTSTEPTFRTVTVASPVSQSALTAITIGIDGYLYVSDSYRVFQLSDNSSPQEFAGSWVSGNANGYRRNAQFSEITGLVADGNGNLYLTDSVYNGSPGRVLKIDTLGTVEDITTGLFDYDTFKWSATFETPTGIALTPSGELIVIDQSCACVRRISMNGKWATTVLGLQYQPVGVAISSREVIYVTNAHRISRISSSDNTETVIAGDDFAGYAEGVGRNARFNNPQGLAISADGEWLYVADTGNHCIRQVNLFDNTVSTFAGTCTQPGSVDSSPLSARFTSPVDVAVAPTTGTNKGAIYVIENDFPTATRVRRISTW